MSDGAGAALVLIDFVNPLDFDGGEALLANALPAARRVAQLRRRARAAGVPTIYVNDNFDAWHLGFRELIERVRAPDVRGAPLTEIVEPDPASDYFILKPLHSGFHQTGLDVLLDRLGVHTLVLTGIAGENCVLFTANDGYMRGFHLVVPADCVASESTADNDQALRQMARVLKADTRGSAELDLAALPRAHAGRVPRGARREGTGEARRRAAAPPA